MKTIELVDLGDELTSMLEEYKFKSKEGINEETLKYAKITRDKVKEGAPVEYRKYEKSIKYTKDTSLLGTDSYVIHAGGIQYVKAHLLEKSHALAKGGRTKAQPHYEPAVKAIERPYIEALKKVLGE